MAHGPSYWPAKEEADKTQRAYDNAVKYDGDKPWKVTEAKKDRDAAAAHLAKVEKTGE